MQQRWYNEQEHKGVPPAYALCSFCYIKNVVVYTTITLRVQRKWMDKMCEMSKKYKELIQIWTFQRRETRREPAWLTIIANFCAACQNNICRITKYILTKRFSKCIIRLSGKGKDFPNGSKEGEKSAFLNFYCDKTFYHQL